MIGRAAPLIGRQAFDACLGVDHRMNVVLKDDLLCWMLKPQGRQPAPIGFRPTLFAGVYTTMPEQKALQMLARLTGDTRRRCP